MPGPVLDIRPESRTDASAPRADTRETPGLLETIAASFEAQRGDNSNRMEKKRQEAYAPLAEELRRLGVPVSRLRTWGDHANQAGEFRYDEILRLVRGYQLSDNYFQGVNAESREAFDQSWIAADREAIERNEEIAARGNPVAGFVGGMGGAMTDPLNIVTLPIGGFGKTVATRIVTEIAAGAAVEAIQQPVIAQQRKEQGRRELTLEEAAANVALGGLGAGAVRGGLEIAPRVLPKIDAAGRKAFTPVRERIDRAFADRDMARAFARQVPPDARTPEQRAALTVLGRESEIDAVNPYTRTLEDIDAHRDKLVRSIQSVEEGRIASAEEIDAAGRPAAVPVEPGARQAEGGAVGVRADFGAVKAAIRVPESAGNDTAVNAAGSSASGRYQFIESTFKQLYKRVFAVADREAAVAWSTRRFDVGVQERLMDRLLEDNADALERSGITADAGNLYLAHFAGAAKAIALSRAPREASVADFFSAQAIRQNGTYLGTIENPKTVGEAIDIIRGKVGGARQLADLDLPPEGPLLRPDALDAERPAVLASGQLIPMETLPARAIEVDAELMQFKSGGDAFGVTERLRGVDEWNPMAAGVVTVWESAAGRRLIADGHQRLGLARRIEEKTGQEIALNAFVLREADGYTALDARVLTALKNIGEGTGSAADAAKVFRDGGVTVEEAMASLPPRSALVRDGKALAQLDDEAFGAVINEVIPESYGAAIAQIAPDRSAHMALVKVLAETDPPNRLQAEAILRQAVDAGFVRETQDELFGSMEVVTGLFAQRAKLLDRALREIRKMRGAFQVAARNAEALDAAGNRIDVGASEAAAAGNARALALVERLALRKGNAVNALLDEAAERLGRGESLAPILRDFIARLRELDFARLDADDGGAAARAGRDGGGDGRSGRAGQPEDQGFQSDELTPQAADAEAADLPRSYHADLDLTGESDARFAQADSAGVRASSESLWHDIDQTDANASARQREETRLRAEAPVRGENATGQAQDGTMGAPLFDAADEADLFDLGDGRGERSVGEIRADIEADRKAIEEIRKCL